MNDRPEMTREEAEGCKVEQTKSFGGFPGRLGMKKPTTWTILKIENGWLVADGTVEDIRINNHFHYCPNLFEVSAFIAQRSEIA